jgi:hypothetical protein
VRERVRSAERAGALDHAAARIDAHDLSPRADEGGQIAHHDPGAAADLEDALARADGDEAQEAPAQARLGRRAPAHLE